MAGIIDEFGTLYPNFSFSPVNGRCIIKDEDTENKPKDFLELTIENFVGHQLPYSFAGQSTSFYNKAASKAPMQSNCDGLLYSEYLNQKVFTLIELKSGFNTDNIDHAKEQILGTLMRLKAQISILQSYSGDYVFRGVIASYTPTTELLTNIKTMTSHGAKFAKTMASLGHVHLEKSVCNRFYSPLDVPDIDIKYIPIPFGHQHYTIDYNDIK